ncbi:MAG: zf-HC2 domain-containing protein [Acidobacteriota bacterium]|nr:zf-HC2 domain-containing protein [Acidobacteriota bacterium]
MSDDAQNPCGPTADSTGKHDAITCQRLILECLFDYESGAMAEDERRQLERHLEACPPCGQFLTSYRATGKTLQMLKPSDVPPALASAVVAFVRSRSRKP